MRIDPRSTIIGAALGALLATLIARAPDVVAGLSSASRGPASSPVIAMNEAHERDPREARESLDAGDATEAWMTANARLAADVVAYRRELATNEAERTDLATKLASTEKRLAALNDGGAMAAKSEFDLSPSDWAELAKRSALRFRVPCERRAPWTPDATVLQQLGLGPGDAATLREAYRRSNERMWAAIRPLCARALNSEALADRLGTRTCTRVINQVEEADDETAKAEARRVAEVRAGLRPEPTGPDVPMNETLLYAMTGEVTRFEADLAASYGPAEAHRIAYDDALCTQDSWLGDIRPSLK